MNFSVDASLGSDHHVAILVRDPSSGVAAAREAVELLSSHVDRITFVVQGSGDLATLERACRRLALPYPEGVCLPRLSVRVAAGSVEDTAEELARTANARVLDPVAVLI